MDPAAWCVERLRDEHSVELHPEVWQGQQCERVGVPLGEQVVHFGVAFVIGHALGSRGDSRKNPRCSCDHGCGIPLRVTRATVRYRLRSFFTATSYALVRAASVPLKVAAAGQRPRGKATEGASLSTCDSATHPKYVQITWATPALMSTDGMTASGAAFSSFFAVLRVGAPASNWDAHAHVDVGAVGLLPQTRSDVPAAGELPWRHSFCAKTGVRSPRARAKRSGLKFDDVYPLRAVMAADIGITERRAVAMLAP